MADRRNEKMEGKEQLKGQGHELLVHKIIPPRLREERKKKIIFMFWLRQRRKRQNVKICL
jgi:hypothetical protein